MKTGKIGINADQQLICHLVEIIIENKNDVLLYANNGENTFSSSLLLKKILRIWYSKALISDDAERSTQHMHSIIAVAGGRSTGINEDSYKKLSDGISAAILNALKIDMDIEKNLNKQIAEVLFSLEKPSFVQDANITVNDQDTLMMA
jgi:hypothetical protein